MKKIEFGYQCTSILIASKDCDAGSRKNVVLFKWSHTNTTLLHATLKPDVKLLVTSKFDFQYRGESIKKVIFGFTVYKEADSRSIVTNCAIEYSSTLKIFSVRF